MPTHTTKGKLERRGGEDLGGKTLLLLRIWRENVIGKARETLGNWGRQKWGVG